MSITGESQDSATFMLYFLFYIYCHPPQAILRSKVLQVPTHNHTIAPPIGKLFIITSLLHISHSKIVHEYHNLLMHLAFYYPTQSILSYVQLKINFFFFLFYSLLICWGWEGCFFIPYYSAVLAHWEALTRIFFGPPFPLTTPLKYHCIISTKQKIYPHKTC